MGFATHLGPWLLGTVRNTTGTTVGTIENCGATVVSQTFKKNYAGQAASATTDTICLLALKSLTFLLIPPLRLQALPPQT